MSGRRRRDALVLVWLRWLVMAGAMDGTMDDASEDADADANV